MAIQRNDTGRPFVKVVYFCIYLGEWAIPGGMVDAGEEISSTLKREFSEEALGGRDHCELQTLWDNKKELYRVSF